LFHHNLLIPRGKVSLVPEAEVTGKLERSFDV
jgi:hypothetical protein